MKSASFVGMNKYFNKYFNKYEIAQYNAAKTNKNDKITAGSILSILRNSQSSIAGRLHISLIKILITMESVDLVPMGNISSIHLDWSGSEQNQE